MTWSPWRSCGCVGILVRGLWVYLCVLLNWLGDFVGVVECLNAPSTGIHAAEVIPSKTKDPYPQLHMEGVGVDGVKSSLAHVSEIHDLINLMLPSPPPPPSLKENRCWPPPNLRPISSKVAALQCPMVQVYQQSLGTFCNILTHVDNCAPLLSTSSGACSEEIPTSLGG